MSTFFPYTPRQDTPESLRACFVAREFLLNELLQSIREQSQENNLQHWMIIGSRGLGKSHLIALLYHSVKEDPGLAGKWVPLLMKEEEQGVFSLHTLFTRILTILSEEVERKDPERAGQLASYLSDLKKGKLSKEDILEGVLACLKDFTAATARKLLVLVENTDDLFTRCVPKTNEIKRLRKIVQHDNHILLIATSPGQFGRITSSGAPLYQFFRIRTLELLSFEHALELLNCWSRMDPDRKEIEPFRREDTKLRVLYHLTGGNPRLLLFLYMAVSGQGGIKRAVDTFSRLLEQDLSNYYLSRMRELSNQEQPIVIALAEADRSLTQKEIAQQTFLPQASIGTAMMRLESHGTVRPVSGKKGKNTLYTLTDHLFRLWYRWRTGLRERKVIEALVEFLGIWYRRKELQAWSGERGSIGLYCREALQFRASERFRKYLEPFKIDAETVLKEKLGHRDYGGFFDTLSLLREWTGEEGRRHLDPVLKGISNGEALDEAIDYLTEKLNQEPDSLNAWVDAGILFDRKGDRAGAERAFAKAAELNPENAHAWFHLGLVRGKQENYAGAEQALSKAVILDPEDAWTRIILGLARSSQGNHASAEQALSKAVELDPKNATAWFHLGLARGEQGNHAGAEEAFERGLQLDPKNAMAWLHLGLARGEQGNQAGAEGAFEKGLQLDPKDAHAWVHLGLTRGKQGNQAGAEEAFDRALALDPDDPSALNGLAVTRFENYSFKDAWEACIRGIQLEVKERAVYGNLVELYLTTEVGNPLSALERALEIEQVESGFHAWISLLHAMVSLSMGDRTPFMKDLKRAAEILESLEDEQRTEIVGELMDFLVRVTYRHALEKVEAYFAGLSQTVQPAASILTPLGYMLDYFKVYFSETQKKGPVGKQAEQVLDRIPSEWRNPVEDMVRRVKEQQAWWERRPKKIRGKE